MNKFQPIYKVIKKSHNNYELHVMFTTRAMCIPNIKSLRELHEIKSGLIEKFNNLDMNKIIEQVIS